MTAVHNTTNYRTLPWLWYLVAYKPQKCCHLQFFQNSYFLTKLLPAVQYLSECQPTLWMYLKRRLSYYKGAGAEHRSMLAATASSSLMYQPLPLPRLIANSVAGPVSYFVYPPIMVCWLSNHSQFSVF